MASRLELHKFFKTLTNNVYYQPPESEKMKYPAIRYERNSIDNTFADDTVYKQSISYRVTLIGFNPDAPAIDVLSRYPLSRYERHYAADGLNHDVFIIYLS